MLTYLEVHIYYTLPPTILLWLLFRPLIGQFDKIKILTLCALAVIYTTPWDNYIIYFKAWWYRKDAVIGRIGLIPIEEYLFFVIQTVFTTLWTMLCTRWTMNSLNLRKPSNRMIFFIKRYIIISTLIILTITGWFHGSPNTKTFYLSAIAWWALPIIIFIWFMAGHYITKRYIAILISIVPPSIYLCYVDVIALRDGVWHINEATSLEILFFNDLPLEEIIFFFGSNTVIVFGSMALDKSSAVLNTYFNDLWYKRALSESTKITERLFLYYKYLAKGAFTDEVDLSSSILDDIETCIKILNKKSKSFSISANLFSNEIKQDLTIIYAFCRVTDDMIDIPESTDLKKERLNVMIKFLNQLFHHRQSKNYFEWTEEIEDYKQKIDWPYFEKCLSDGELSAFRSISRIAYYLPHQPFYELVEGYKWDIEEKPVRNEFDLMEYSKYVASSVATLCIFVCCYKSNQWPDNFGPACQYMIENARKMGMVLQIVNISRDIIIDSETLGRCYIPLDYFNGNEFDVLLKQRNPHVIGNRLLKQYARKMINLADKLANESIFSIILLPIECQRPILTALEIYQGIGKAIKTNELYERRAYLNKFNKVKIILKCMYFTNIESFRRKLKIESKNS